MPFDTAGFGLTPEQLADLSVIRDAREQIAAGSWCKGQMAKFDNRCAVGWLVEFDGDFEHVGKIAKTYFNPMIPNIPEWTVQEEDALVWFNDRRSTRRSHMVALFDKVIQNLENQNAV